MLILVPATVRYQALCLVFEVWCGLLFGNCIVDASILFFCCIVDLSVPCFVGCLVRCGDAENDVILCSFFGLLVFGSF